MDLIFFGFLEVSFPYFPLYSQPLFFFFSICFFLFHSCPLFLSLLFYSYPFSSPFISFVFLCFSLFLLYLSIFFLFFFSPSFILPLISSRHNPKGWQEIAKHPSTPTSIHLYIPAYITSSKIHKPKTRPIFCIQNTPPCRVGCPRDG